MRRVTIIAAGAFVLAVASSSWAQVTAAALREQRERELAIVQHLRAHLADPADGLALAADRRDLDRVVGVRVASPGAPPGATASETELLESLAVVADLWHERVVGRLPFGLMARDRLAALPRAQQALGQLQSRGGRPGGDRFLPELQQEIAALTRFAAGQGEIPEQQIDVALRVADAAATGRPMLGPGPYAGPSRPPMGGPPAGVPPGPYGPNAPQPAPPPGGQATPYSLPPIYQEYGAGGTAAAATTVASCHTLRQAGGASSSASDMLRAAECWTRMPTWPGWASQALEALDWAVTYASVDRDCAALATVTEKVRELGPRIGAGGLTRAVTRLAERAELDGRWLRSSDQCRP